MRKSITAARTITIISMMFLVATTFFLRSSLLGMINHLVDHDDITAQAQIDRYNSSTDNRQEQYELQMVRYESQLARYDIAMEKYKELLALYASDFDAYQQKIGEDGNTMPPQMPWKPTPPSTPEFQQKLADASEAFRNERNTYFRRAQTMNPIVGLAAVCLVGSLLYLIFFDANGSRLMYAIVLALSFIFIIGPSFHTVLSIIAWNLHAPGY